ncbi:hypothetical protein MCEMSEM18_03597 [Comamonadaceae bacterium]
MNDTLTQFPFPLRLVRTIHGPRLGWFQDGKLTSLGIDAKSIEQHKLTLTDAQIEAISEMNYTIGDAAATAHSAASRVIAKTLGNDSTFSLNSNPLTMDLFRESIIEGIVNSINHQTVTKATPA